MLDLNPFDENFIKLVTIKTLWNVRSYVKDISLRSSIKQY